MRVTPQNAEVALKEFEELLSQCSFCAIDEEMTGVDADGFDVDLDDNNAALYTAKREACLIYSACQLGIVLFVPTNKLKKPTDLPEEFLSRTNYKGYAFNFYLRKNTGDITIKARNIPFLHDTGMNFEAWMTQNLPYFTEEEERELVLQLEEEGKMNCAPELADLPLPRHLKNLITVVSTKVNQMLTAFIRECLRKSKEYAALDGPEEWEAQWETMSPLTFILPRSEGSAAKRAISNCFQDHYLAQVTMKELEISRDLHLMLKPKRKVFEPMVKRINSWVASHPKGTYSDTDEDTLRKILVEEFKDRHQNDTAAKIRAALGFRPFWKALVAAKKPLVGHNFFHDLMFLYHMNERTLPESYSEFKIGIGALFSHLWDTKTIETVLMRGEMAFPRTDLENVFKHYTRLAEEEEEGSESPLATYLEKVEGEWVEQTCESGKESSLAQQILNHLHEATADAFMTGYAFIAQGSVRNAKALNQDAGTNGKRAFINDGVLESYQNVICGFKCSAFVCLPFGAGALSEDIPMYPHTLLLKTESLCNGMEVRDALFDLLWVHKRKNKLGVRIFGGALFVVSLKSNQFGCSNTFYVLSISKAIHTTLLAALSKLLRNEVKLETIVDFKGAKVLLHREHRMVDTESEWIEMNPMKGSLSVSQDVLRTGIF